MNEDANKIVSYLRSRPWRLIAVAPWPVQLAVLYVVVGTFADVLQNGFRFGFGAYTVISLVVAFVMTTLILSFRRVRIVIGILVLVLGCICLLSVGKGFSFADIGVAYTMFFVCALLLGKASRQWNADAATLNGDTSEVSAVVEAAKSVWRQLLAQKIMLGLVVLGVVLYVAGMIGAMMDANADGGGRARRTSAKTARQDDCATHRAWYEEQLRYNNVEEIYFKEGPYGSWQLTLLSRNPGASPETISVDGEGSMTYPRNMPAGFAEKLLTTRIEIYKATGK